MKGRLSSLDGLRGLAALAVVLSHIDNTLVLQATGQVITGIFRTISAGPNAVQILFVLTGFLMAYLYPSIDSSAHFIQKRYTRIFPTFIFLAVFFWLIGVTSLLSNWLMQLLLIVVLAFFVRLVWQFIKLFDSSGKLGEIIFYGFIVLQLFVAASITLVLPHVLTKVPEGSLGRGLFILMSNVTLTMPLSLYTPRLSLVFWSLFAEVLFYICYPFLVIPIVEVSRKWGWIVGIFFVIFTTKILFDIDSAVMYQGGLLVTNLARASGFVAGVVVGTIYQQQASGWKMLEKIFKHPLINSILLGVFIIMEWGDAYIRNVASQQDSNYYFLVSSWIIAAIIIAALIKGSIIEKIFSHKLLIFLGMVSYTLYLSHEQVIVWVLSVIGPLQNILPLWLYVALLVVSVTVFSVGIAWLLYKLVDSLYFAYRRKLLTETTVTNKKSSFARIQKKRLLSGGLIVYILVIIGIYTAKYPLSLLIERQKLDIPNRSQYATLSLLQHPAYFSFVAKHNNLSIVALAMRYKDKASLTEKKPHHAILQFNLYDSSHHIIFTSTNTAYMVEGEPEFQFGFPPILNSQSKKYLVEIQLIEGNVHDQVLLDNSLSNLVTMYSPHKSILYPIPFILNRLWFAILTPPAFLALLFVPILVVLSLAEKIWNVDSNARVRERRSVGTGGKARRQKSSPKR